MLFFNAMNDSSKCIFGLMKRRIRIHKQHVNKT